jgi:hypothetical protein
MYSSTNAAASGVIIGTGTQVLAAQFLSGAQAVGAGLALAGLLLLVADAVRAATEKDLRGDNEDGR